MKISVPNLSLVLLVGASGCGKSTFARRHFKPTEVLSSDFCRGLVADNENDQSATPDAFDVLYYIARKRLSAARLTVIDATNVKAEDRKSLIELARESCACRRDCLRPARKCLPGKKPRTSQRRIGDDVRCISLASPSS